MEPAEPARAAGEVGGTAFGPGVSPTGPPVPLTGLTLVLLPRSDSLLEELERLRLQSRESLTAYRSTIPEMRRRVEAAVAGLRAAGQAAAIHGSTVDAAGRFTLPEVSAGPCILIGYRSVHVDRGAHDTAKESGTFLPQPRLVGYERVSMWLQAFAVEPGRPAAVELTDRNVWFEGVEEKTAARARTPNTGSRRRSARSNTVVTNRVTNLLTSSSPYQPGFVVHSTRFRLNLLRWRKILLAS